ncbi:MAG: FGGY-family carbohydrate kinase, partial [Aggregatilineales bacterium]
DVRIKAWAHPKNWKWQALDLTPDKMPDLVTTGDIIATISSQAANETGIPAGLPLIAAAADKACEVIGSGTTAPHIGAISYGTTATINVLTQKYFESTPFLPPYPAALPDAYNVEIQIYRGYWMVNWFKEEFGHQEQNVAATRNIPPETLFDELVNAVLPGSDGLILQPYWTPGIRQPGPEARGAIIGFHDGHTRAHVYRAILEGVAYALREGQERLEKRGKLKIRELRVSGGGSQSDAAMQVTANVFNLPVLRPHTYETSGLGAAIIASVGLGLHPDTVTAIKNMTRISDTFLPQSQHVTTYEHLYQQVYKPMYSRLQPLYKMLSKQ